MDSQKTLILIDGHALAFRQYFALERTGMKTSDGLQSWAVYGFFKAVFDLLKNQNIKPDAIAVTFDVGRETFRTEKYSEYKAQRVAMPDSLHSQLGLIIEGLKAFNIPIYTKKGFEADDVIGTICKKASELGHKTLILTGDQDSFQLIGKDELVKVLIPSKGELITYDWDKVYEKLGVYPDQVVDYKALRGDVSDNIPGIKGIGEKTAQKLLSRYYRLEELLENCQEIPEAAIKKKICEGVEIANLSKFLATIDCNVDIDFDFQSTKIELPVLEEVVSFLKKMQFYSFVKNIDNILCWFDKDCDKENNSNEKIVKIEEKSNTEVKLSAEMQLGLFSDFTQQLNEQVVFDKITVDDIDEFVLKIRKQKNISLFVMADFVNAVEADVLGIAITFIDEEKIKSFYIKNDFIKIKNVLEDENIKKSVFDLKNNLNVLKNINIDLKGVDIDVELASYINNPNKSHDISAQAIDYLNYILKAPRLSKKSLYASLSANVLFEYALECSYIIFKLVEYWEKELSEIDKRLLDEMEMPLSIVLAKMERDGVALDKNYLKQLSDFINNELNLLEKKIFELAGCEFNVNSPKQVGDVLYNKLGIKSTKKTKGKTSLSTSVEILEELAKDYEICKYLIKQRQFSKLKSTYTDALPQLISKVDNRVHTSYNQTITVTGRLSSSNPNLQNIPIRTEEGNKIRQAFVAGFENGLIFSSDYSQIELRLLAHVSEDENLVNAFYSDVDVHTLTASKVFEVPVESVTKKMRYKAKAVNFGIIYGQSRYGLAKALDITPQDAQIFIDKYFYTYPKVKEYMEKTINFAHKNGYVETIFGRRRYLGNELESPNRMIKEFAERAAINQPLQGTAADLIKFAMIKIQNELEKEKFKSKMIMQVHDELVFDVAFDEFEKLKLMVVEAMENVKTLKVPLIVDTYGGRSWKE